MDAIRSGKATVTVRYKIPTLVWWRLRAYARWHRFTMPIACADVLNVGLDTLGITSDGNRLLSGIIEDSKAIEPGQEA